MIAAVQYNTDFKNWAIYNPAMAWTCFSGAIASMCAITCCFGRKVPINYILLFVFTFCESYMVAGLTAFYEPDVVMLAGLTTALVTISLTIYAMFTKTDIKIFMALVFVLYLAMLPMCIIGAIMRTRGAYIAYCAMGLIFYSLFLIIDTMIICKNNKSLGG